MEVDGRAGAERPVEAVEEVTYRVAAADRPAVALTASPCDPADLAAGHLLARGFSIAALARASYRVDGSTVRVALPDGALDAGACLRAHYATEGVGHVLRCDGCAGMLSRGDAAPPTDDALRDLLAAIFGPNPGVHAAGLARGDDIVLRVEDVGRHSAVDRLLGAALRAQLELGGLGLVTTARVSGEMAFKAARGGLAWIASRSVPTTLALDIAALVDLPIVARAGSPRARTFVA